MRFDRRRDRNLNRYLSRLERSGRASFYEGDHLYGVTVDPSVEESLRTQRRALRIRFTFLLENIKYLLKDHISYLLYKNKLLNNKFFFFLNFYYRIIFYLYLKHFPV